VIAGDATAPLRILIVATSPVLPASHGGRVRTHRLAVGLARAGAQVEVLHPWAPGAPRRPRDVDGVRFHPHFLPANALAFVFRDRLVPSMIAHSWQPFALGPKRRLDRFSGWDVAQFEHVGRARWMRRTSARLVVYSSHNVEVDFRRTEPAPAALRTLTLRAIAALERRACRDSDLVLACTQRDAERLGELYGPLRRTEVVPNGFDGDLLRGSREDRDAVRATLGIPAGAWVLVFVGSATAHNLEAIRFLQHDVLPRLDARFHLLLVGNCGPATAEAPGLAGRVHRSGRVDDLGPMYAAADVAVNPVTSGSGSNLKLAEYLASGLPVVTTPVGLRGFERHADSVVVATPEDFAEAIASVRPGAVRRDGVEDLSWAQVAQRLHDTYRTLLRP
jgi:glycosyltransferase involved in cell wall biosynthesis